MATNPDAIRLRQLEEERRWRRNQAAKQRAEAEKTLHQIEVDRIKARERAEKERLAAAKAADKEAAAEEKAILSEPVTKYTGATRKNTGSIIVWHWLVEPPADVVMKQRRSGTGPLLALRPNGGNFTAEDAVYGVIKSRYPEIATDHPKYVANMRKALAEITDRYTVLTRLRDDKKMRGLFEKAEVCIKDVNANDQIVGEYDSYKRTLTKIDVPTLIEAAITPDGLVLTYKHRPGDSSKKWTSKIDLLKNMFRSLGMDAANLKIVDDDDGNIRLEFNDAPNVFPKAVASEPVTAPATVEAAIAAYPKLNWEFGVDARGNRIAARITDNSHIALIAQTNWGKSVLSASLIEHLRPFGAWWIFDGKGSDHPTTLASQPGIAWISKTAPEHVVGMKWLWDEMNERYLASNAAKARGESNATAFNYPPIFVLIDETPSLRGGINTHDKNGMDDFDFWVQDLGQKGRQCRIHLIIISQDLYVDSIPSSWQKNLGRMIFLGPISSRSLASDAVPESVRDRVAEMTARIPDSAKGRGVYLDRSGGSVRPVQIQTYYDWAPGTTSLDMAPTAEVRSAWEKQRAALNDRPVLFDRVGIQVSDASWRKLSVEELAELPTCIVTDANGEVIDGMEGYDPLSEQFYGRVRITANKNRARGRGSGVQAPPIIEQPAEVVVKTPTPASPAPVTVETKPMDDDSLLQALAEAQRRGLIKPPEVQEPEPTPEPIKKPAAQPASRSGGEF